MSTILENAPSRFPDRPISDAPEKWWVAKVKPRQEKQIALDLFRSGIEYYLPLYSKNTPRPGTNHKRVFNVPLFPGYISFSQNIPRDIFRSSRIVSIIEIRNQKKFIQELEQIYSVGASESAILEPCAETLTNGMEVEIYAGHLKGLRGFIKSHTAARLILTVAGLGTACLNVEKLFVRPVTENSAAFCKAA